MTDVKISGLITNMEDMVEVIGILRFRLLYGTFFIILGIILAIVTYRYVFPIGSIMLVLSGIILIFWERWMGMMSGVILKNENKEI